jgi:soluble lytic murein transglycosylase-like protein
VADYNKLLTMHMPNYLSIPVFLLLAVTLQAQVFVYEDSRGEKIISDYPLPESDYTLISEKKSLRNLGKFISNRPVEQDQQQIDATIERASARHKVEPSLVKAVVKAESSFDSRALSAKGAMGLMQLMDDTADQYQVYDSLSPEENIDAGVRHLSKLLKRYKGDTRRALAAYNAGITAVEKYNGIPPYPETQRYVAKVLSFQRQFQLQDAASDTPKE